MHDVGRVASFWSTECDLLECDSPVQIALRGFASWSLDGMALTFMFEEVNDALDRFATRPSALQVSLAPGASVCSARFATSGADITACQQYAGGDRRVQLTGTWGASRAPELAAVVCSDTGNRQGLNAGDSLLLVFDAPVVGGPDLAQTVAAIQFSASIAGELTAEWADPLSLRLVVGAASGLLEESAADGLHVGTLAVAVTEAAGIVARDMASAPVHSSQVVSGTWGDAPSAVEVEVASATSVRVVLRRPNNNPTVEFTVYRLEWRPAEAGDAPFQRRDVMVPPTSGSASVLVDGLTPNQPVLFRGRVNGVLRGSFGPPSTQQPTATPVYPTLAGVYGAQVMATQGGESLEIEGANLGLLGSRIELVYFNSPGDEDIPSRTINATGCVVTQAGVAATCLTGPGTGRRFSWLVVVQGFASEPWYGVETGYTIPSVSSLTIDGGLLRADTEGGEGLVITGDGFGPVEFNAVTRVEYGPILQPHVRFVAGDCRVTVAHTRIECLTATGGGANLDFSVVIDGQTSSTPTARYFSPSITSVEVVGEADTMNTEGGDVVRLRGSNFGAPSEFARPRARYSAAWMSEPLEAHSCAITVAHEEVTCVTVEGFGTAWRWTLSTYGQTSEESTSTLSYAAPEVLSLGVAMPPTDGTGIVHVVGRNFGSPNGGAAPRVTVQGVAATVTSHSSHSSLSFRAPPGTGTAMVVVDVAGQASEPVKLTYEAPVLLALDVDVDETGSGDDFDAVLAVHGRSLALPTSVVSDVLVSIGDAPCNVSYVSPLLVLCSPPVSEGPVSVVFAGNTSNTLHYDERDLLQPPTIDSVSPVTLAAAGDTIISITGSQLRAIVSFVFNDEAECVLVGAVTPTTAQCRAPPGHGEPRIVAVVGALRSTPFTGARYEAPELVHAYPSLLPTVETTVVLYGSGFGASANPLVTAQPLVRVSGDLVEDSTKQSFGCDVQTFNDTHIDCFLPPRALQAVSITVAFAAWGSSSAATVATNALIVAYEGPVVDAVFPAHGPTQGGNEVNVTGRHFGDSGRVWIGDAECAVTVFTSTLISCVATAGGGLDLSVVVDNGRLRSDEVSTATYDYDAPLITTVSPPSGPTGGFVLEVGGINLGGLNNAAVTVTLPYLAEMLSQISGVADTSGATSECVVSAATHAMLRCTLPAGRGSANVLSVDVAGQSTTALISYDAPTLVSLDPPVVYANDPGVLRITGTGFGWTEPVHVAGTSDILSVVARDGGSEVSCGAVTWISDTEIECTFRGLAVGTRNVSVSVVDQASDQALQLRFRCVEQFYGREGEMCRPCPTGAWCDGEADPVPTTGYWRVSRSEFVECKPPEACSGVSLDAIEQGGEALEAAVAAAQERIAGSAADHACAVGYRGDLCSSCQSHPDPYYRFNERCVKCPTIAFLYFIAFFVALAALAASGLWLKKTQVDLASLTILVDYAQTLSVFSGFGFAWPAAVRSLFDISTITTLNIEIVA